VKEKKMVKMKDLGTQGPEEILLCFTNIEEEGEKQN
jgi:hypothetical protein